MTDDDRKMLELAAKAINFGSVHESTGELQNCWTESEYPRGSGKYGALWNYVGYMDTAELWNPLTDDGDALRLAVKLQLAIAIDPDQTWAHHVEVMMGSAEPHGDDPNAATRRAIVRAAAATVEGGA